MLHFHFLQPMLHKIRHLCTTVEKNWKVVVISEQVEGAAANSASMPPPPQFDAPHFQDFASSVLEALNSSAVKLAALNMEAIECSAPPPGPIEESDGNLQNDVIQKYDKCPTEPENDNLQGYSVGHVVDSQSITALEAQLQEAVSAEISMNCPQNFLTDSYVSNELPSEPRYVSISFLSLPLFWVCNAMCAFAFNLFLNVT